MKENVIVSVYFTFDRQSLIYENSSCHVRVHFYGKLATDGGAIGDREGVLHLDSAFEARSANHRHVAFDERVASDGKFIVDFKVTAYAGIERHREGAGKKCLFSNRKSASEGSGTGDGEGVVQFRSLQRCEGCAHGKVAGNSGAVVEFETVHLRGFVVSVPVEVFYSLGEHERLVFGRVQLKRFVDRFNFIVVADFVNFHGPGGIDGESDHTIGRDF